MSPETYAPTADTLQEAIDATLAQDIAHGFHVPSYGELLAYRERMATFQPAYSSINSNHPTVYEQRPINNARATTVLSKDEYDLSMLAATDEHWLISRRDRAGIDTLLAATSLDDLPGSGRHRHAHPEDDAEELAALQYEARRHVALDSDIRLAQARAARLAPAAGTLGATTVGNLTDDGSTSRFFHTAPAAPSLDPVKFDADGANSYALQPDRAPITQTPGRWSRLWAIGRRILSLGL